MLVLADRSPGVHVRLVTSPRSTFRTVAIVLAALVAACGSSKKTAVQGELCVQCHGDAARSTAIARVDANLKAAPPAAVNGATATTDPKVGAHQAHLVAGRLRGPIACNECHVVPADMTAHEAEIARIKDGAAQAVTFGGLAIKGDGPAAYDEGTLRCSNTYCHGATINQGGFNHAPLWTGGASEATCTSCHGYPPAAATGHPSPASDCHACHPATVAADNFTIIVTDGVSTHIDGLPTIDPALLTQGCTFCHPQMPPTSGAHASHTSADAVATPATAYGNTGATAAFSPTSATAYAFGCGNCHPLLGGKHLDGILEVELTPDTGTAGTLRGMNSPTAAWEPVGRTCSGVYCHSSGQATPDFVAATPGWYSGATLGCNGCHANPPSYASGGAGTATANSHVQLDPAGAYEWGHFAGFPGVTHDGSKHGGVLQPSTAYWYGQASAPITCQTCHYDTAAATNVGPSGFYYLDSSGNYEISDAVVSYTYSCTACHDGSAAAAGTGKVMPYFHVNGARDVRFDPRTDLTGMDATYAAANLPASPNTPTRPYWFTNGSPLISGIPSLPADAVANGSTLSMDLQSAGWNATSKTCSSVACHFNQTSVQWGGQGGESSTSCSACHTL